MSIIAKCALVGVVASCITVGTICYFSVLKYADDSIDRSEATAFKPGLMNNIDGLVAIVFGFGSVLVVPSIKANIKDPSKINTAIHGSNISVTLINMITCLAAFFGFASLLGEVDQSNGEYVTKWMGDGEIINGVPEHFSVIAIIAIAAVGLSCVIGYPLVCNGVFEVVETAFPSLQPTKVRCGWRAGFVLATSLSACIAGKFFGPILGFIASAFMLPMIYMFPLSAYWYLVYTQYGQDEVKARKTKLVLHLVLLIIVILSSIIGTIAAFKNMTAKLF